MRISIYTCLIFLFCFPYTSVHGVHLGDAVLLKRFQAASFKINKHPTLWQVSHYKKSWDNTQTNYELLVEFPDPPKDRPQLTLYHGPFAYTIEVKNHTRGRALVMTGPISLKDAQSEMVEGISPHPLGTFDFGVFMPADSDVYSRIFNGLEDNLFTGAFRILEGLPTLIYDKESSPWRLELINNSFFPKRVVWKSSSSVSVQWDFLTSIDYQPWGIADAELKEIIYAELNQKRHSSENIYKTQWTLIKRFTSSTELHQWKTQDHERVDIYYTPWIEEQRLNILRAY